MSNLVIVAIPDENDRVWKVSSEKVPHLTLLYLGDSDEVSNLEQIVQFVEHAANTTLKRFYLPVDRRDALGEGEADTLIFKKGRYDYKAIRDFRVQLLKDNNIRKAYDSATQHDGVWLPHLTLGYPETPAKPDDTDRDFGFYDVGFNKIAVWPGDFEGPEFLLKDYWDEWDSLETVPMDVAWSGLQDMNPEERLAHYGKKGMHWGVRNDEKAPDGSVRKWLDPEGHDKGSDLIKAFVWPLVPPLGLFSGPAQIRLTVGAARGTKAKLDNVKDVQFEKKVQSQKNFVRIHNGATPKINSSIDAVNKKYPMDLTKDSKAKAKYDAEITKSLQEAYRESANSIGNKMNTKHLDVEFRNDGQDFAIKSKEGAAAAPVEKIKHATEDEEVTFTGKLQRNATGHILGLVFDDFKHDVPATAMAQSIEDGAEFLVHKGLMTPDYFLEHYGVMGWIVNEEANPEKSLAQTMELGTLFLTGLGISAEGIEHFGTKGMRWGVRNNKGTPTAVTPQATSRVPPGDKRKTKIQVEGGQNHDASPDAIKVAEATAKLKKSGVKTLSNSELQEVAKRLQLEGQVKQLVAPAGAKFIKSFLKNQGQQQANQFVNQKVKEQFAK